MSSGPPADPEQSPATQDDWSRRRREAAATQAERAARAKQQETERARQLIEDFTAQARHRLTPRPLLARAGDGKARYRTGLTGWYLRREGTVGVSQDGEYYNLSAPTSLKARLVGVTLVPSDPPLVVGRGGRDGESIDLRELLELRLAAGDDWQEPG